MRHSNAPKFRAIQNDVTLVTTIYGSLVLRPNSIYLAINLIIYDIYLARRYLPIQLTPNFFHFSRNQKNVMELRDLTYWFYREIYSLYVKYIYNYVINIDRYKH